MKRPDKGFLSRLQTLAGDNLSEFARKVGMPQSQVHGYVTGRNTPSYRFFARLGAMEVDLNWLILGKVTRSSVTNTQADFTDNKNAVAVQQLLTELHSLKEKDVQEILDLLKYLALKKRTIQNSPS
jgi:transcriptional regulator with XRE-family HTH domain